jgi:hypothetical protein
MAICFSIYLHLGIANGTTNHHDQASAEGKRHGLKDLIGKTSVEIIAYGALLLRVTGSGSGCGRGRIIVFLRFSSKENPSTKL